MNNTYPNDEFSWDFSDTGYESRRTDEQRTGRRVSRGTAGDRPFRERGRSFLPEMRSFDTVDIVCCVILAVALILVLCNWRAVMSALFFGIMFPLIRLLTSSLALILLIIALICGLFGRARRRRRWYY